MTAAFDLDEFEPWPVADPLDRAYRSAIVPEGQRWASAFTYRPTPPPDSVTILRALGGHVLAKRVHGGGKIVDYDQAARFDMTRRHVRNLDDIEALLRWLAGRPDRCIVRGNIASGQYVEHNKPRLLHDRKDRPATIAETARQWLAIDIDDFPDEATLVLAEQRIMARSGISTVMHLPRSVAPGDLVSAALVATSVLPKPFYSAEYIVQATASHGLKAGLRVRLWFMLDRAITTGEAKFWFRHSPVDLALFSDAQIVYTASPIFETGAVDPVLERLVRIPGREQVNVPAGADLRPAPKLQAAKPDRSKAGISPWGERALDDAEHTILSARQGRQEPTLVREAYRVGRVVASGDLPERFARAVLSNIGRRIPDLNPAWPWTAAAVDDKIGRAFDAGLRRGRHA